MLVIWITVVDSYHVINVIMKFYSVFITLYFILYESIKLLVDQFIRGKLYQ